MTSSRDTLKAFTDAAADAVARTIASIQREAQRDREVRDAQFSARMAEFEMRIASVSELERKLEARLSTLKDGEPGTSVTAADVEPIIAASVERVLSTWEKPQDGVSVDPAEVERMVSERVAEAVAQIRVPEDGKSIDQEAVAELVRAEVAKIPVPVDGKDADPELVRKLVETAIAAIPPAPPGKDADQEEIWREIAEQVKVAVEAIPAPQDGRSVTVDDVLPIIEELVAAIPPAERGPEGPAGKLPIVKAWEDRVYYEGDVVTHEGAAYQASRDTGRAPPHEDWTCIIRAGKDGQDGRSFEVRSTYQADEQYRALDVVALGGATFVARRDNPGPCPGEGWQLMSAQGKTGKPGERGGIGPRGNPGPAVIEATADDQGMVTLVNADGSRASLDLYPLLSRLQR